MSMEITKTYVRLGDHKFYIWLSANQKWLADRTKKRIFDFSCARVAVPKLVSELIFEELDQIGQLEQSLVDLVTFERRGRTKTGRRRPRPQSMMEATGKVRLLLKRLTSLDKKIILWRKIVLNLYEPQHTATRLVFAIQDFKDYIKKNGSSTIVIKDKTRPELKQLFRHVKMYKHWHDTKITVEFHRVHWNRNMTKWLKIVDLNQLCDNYESYIVKNKIIQSPTERTLILQDVKKKPVWLSKKICEAKKNIDDPCERKTEIIRLGAQNNCFIHGGKVLANKYIPLNIEDSVFTQCLELKGKPGPDLSYVSLHGFFPLRQLLLDDHKSWYFNNKSAHKRTRAHISKFRGWRLNENKRFVRAVLRRDVDDL